MKFPKMAFIYLLIAVPVMAMCFSLVFSGTVVMEYNGFAVDSDNVLYIGTNNEIQKYSKGKLIGTINPRTSRTYAFTMQDDDTIVLSTSSTVYIMDSFGNVVSQTEDEYGSVYNSLQRKRTFCTSDGKEYRMKSPFLRTEIVSPQGERVYQMPLLDYVVRLAFVMFFISGWIIIPWSIVKAHRNNLSDKL